jgi:hypothetical protein
VKEDEARGVAGCEHDVRNGRRIAEGFACFAVSRGSAVSRARSIDRGHGRGYGQLVHVRCLRHAFHVSFSSCSVRRGAVTAGFVVAGVMGASSSPCGAQEQGEPDWPQPPPDEYAETDPSALTDFRPALDPHGTWVDDPTYGTAWTPDPNEVGPGFQPYDTGGQWDYAGGEYSWVSDFAWGWVCFHYGRWVFAGQWLWIPGREYAAAWVEWRVGDEGFPGVGWEPMPPSWIWQGTTPVALGYVPAEPWTFAAPGDMFGPGLAGRAATGRGAAGALSHSRPFVPAQPTVSPTPPTRRLLAHGPPLERVGIDAATIVHAPARQGEQRARLFAHPSTALALGAHAPAVRVMRPAPRRAAVATPVQGRAGNGGGGGGGHGRR